MGDQQKKKMTYKRVKPPTGFHFNPTDEILVEHYLIPKKFTHSLQFNIFPEAEVYSCHPKKLTMPHPSIAKNTWYFFTKLYRLSRKDHRRPCRKTKDGSGIWKNRGTEVSIPVSPDKRRELIQFFPEGVQVFKKLLVFYTSNSPTPWIMDEYVAYAVSQQRKHPVDPAYVDHCALCCIRYRENWRYGGEAWKEIVEDEEEAEDMNVGNVASTSGVKRKGEEIVTDEDA